ncbi:MAG: DNA recombination protein RmuC [Burkholderiales bacterium]|nr:DNA recombination protein RmuC [Burkholderiales bacterium]
MNNLTLLMPIAIVGGLIIICLLVVYAKLRGLNQTNLQNTQLQHEYNELNALHAKLDSDQTHTKQELARINQALLEQHVLTKEFELENKQLQRNNLELSSAKSRLEVENEHLKLAYQQLEKLLVELKIQMNSEFSNLKNLAINELKERADNSLRDISKENVVLPLQEYLKDLQLKINELTLETKVINRNSADLNLQAQNLALALTKDSKKKGEFGEMILANILESVGLQQHVSYTEQAQITLNDKRLIPDVIINLPHNRAVVVDSKNIIQRYYESIVNQEDKSKAILDAIKLTIKSLSNKDYLQAVEQAIGKAVFDYAIMFIPNEGLFSLIIEEDQKLSGALLRDAYKQRIFIAGPSTLLVLLGMIERAWETYQVEERAEEIIRLAIELTDKFKISLQKIADLGNTIRQTGTKYDEVIKSLDNGTAGSAIAKLDKLALLSGEKRQLARIVEVGQITTRLPSSARDEECSGVSRSSRSINHNHDD